MSNKIQLDIISDVMCPWCVVGYKNLEQAITELGLAEQVELEWQPFELNPDMPQEGENLRDHIMRKYGSSAEESQSSREQLVARGQAVGFDFNFYDSMRMVNSRHLHVLLDFALAYGKQTELKLRFFNAHFTEEKDLADLEVIAQELEAVGLDSNKALKRLKNADNVKKIEAQEFEWQRMGISAVPTVVFNRKSAVTGAQTVETYKQILQELIAES
ncbi:DsbA family oxidoreductase [Vibrio sp. L3-7]|uniref:DsbA family oxidoreductase n=1 Tax=Vibrio sp. L3-7 TaxID=2912253 RepID=UPI00118F8415|nr:DsbA family oxidoreductase [Vibrio sp. L3-7]MCF7506821.1 DsbA family oxidoreductase [Vibrio sp. L3-7]TVU67616.1 DsbA family oxidoreductase [Vibrio tasmaniensis]